MKRSALEILQVLLLVKNKEAWRSNGNFLAKKNEFNCFGT